MYGMDTFVSTMQPMIASDAFTTDLNKATPYSAAKQMLRTSIMNGDVGHGEKLTPELDLCRKFNVSRSTIRRAILELVDEGLVERFQGRGTFVCFRRNASQRKLLAILLCQHENVRGAYDLLLRGAMHRAAGLGYEMIISNSRNESFTGLEQAGRLNELRTAGAIVIPLQSGGQGRGLARIVKTLRGGDQKLVLADNYTPESEIPSISSQNLEAMHKLTTHMIEAGHRRIAFLTSQQIEPVFERENGFRQAMQEHGLDIPPHYFLQVEGTDPALQGRQAVDVFMAMREPPEAIICLHDLIALNVIDQCSKRGWKVPDDVAVAGFDDLPQSATCRPAITTIHQPLYEMGERAVDLLVAQLEGRPINEPHPRLPCDLIVRESCGGKLQPA
jgi:DNA-binding LacI/PurR family transcriptional regulator